MFRRHPILVFSLIFAAAVVPLWPSTKRPEGTLPNVILIVVDDMGWMDSEPYGSLYYETPNVQRLAEQGMLFTDAYASSPLCSPTRASILTGKYPARMRLTSAVGHLPPLAPDAPTHRADEVPWSPVRYPISRRFLDTEEITLAETLRDAGYRTAHIGKWHLGKLPEHWPERQGFDVVIRGVPEMPTYHAPYGFSEGALRDGPLGEYLTDRLTREAVNFIREHRNETFFLNLWHYGVHGPWGHKSEITERYLDRQDPRGKQGNPIMASMLWSIDESLGRILETLDALGLADDTILIVTSDNGGNSYSYTEGDAGRLNIQPDTRLWPEVLDYRSYAGFQAPTSNAPLREGKGWLYEGGVRVPLLVRWPGKIPPGQRTDVVVSTIDLFPTILQLIGIRPGPAQYFDGVSYAALLTGGAAPERQAIFNFFPHPGVDYCPPGVSVRKGDWKLIRWFETNEFFRERYELYDLARDLGETRNLAATEPAVLAELDALIDRFLEQTGALVPVPNPRYDPDLQPLGTWWPINRSRLRLANGILQIRSAQGRVQMRTRDVPKTHGALAVRMRVRSNDARYGALFWRTAGSWTYDLEHVVRFQTLPDGNWQEVEIPFSADRTLEGVRLDVSMFPGTVELDWVRLQGPHGTILRQWDFAEQPATVHEPKPDHTAR